MGVVDARDEQIGIKQPCVDRARRVLGDEQFLEVLEFHGVVHPEPTSAFLLCKAPPTDPSLPVEVPADVIEQVADHALRGVFPPLPGLPRVLGWVLALSSRPGFGRADPADEVPMGGAVRILLRALMPVRTPLQVVLPLSVDCSYTQRCNAICRLLPSRQARRSDVCGRPSLLTVPFHSRHSQPWRTSSAPSPE